MQVQRPVQACVRHGVRFVARGCRRDVGDHLHGVVVYSLYGRNVSKNGIDVDVEK